MRGSVARPVGRALKLVAMEVMCLLLTQPIRPFFRFLRRWQSLHGTPIVFIHGYAQSSATFWALAFRLAQRRAGPMYGFDYFSFTDMRVIADRLDRFVERICRDRGVDRVHLVCHSMGGLVAMEYMRRHGSRRVERCVTIATPHDGVRFRGPIPGACGRQMRAGCSYLAELASAPLSVPVMSISSKDDVIFFASSSPSLCHRGGCDVVLEEVGHLSMLFDAVVSEHVHGFLCDVIEVAPQSGWAEAAE